MSAASHGAAFSPIFFSSLRQHPESTRKIQPPEPPGAVRIYNILAARRSPHKVCLHFHALSQHIIFFDHRPLHKLCRSSRRNSGGHTGTGTRSQRRRNIDPRCGNIWFQPPASGKSPAGIDIKTIIARIIGGYCDHIICQGRLRQCHIRRRTQEIDVGF